MKTNNIVNKIVRRFLLGLTPPSQTRRPQRSWAPASVEELETRRMLSGAAVASPQSVIATTHTVFSDNFNSGASSQWGNQQGSWTATGGVYAASVLGSAPNSHSTLPFSLADFTVEMDIKSLSDGGIWLRSSEAPGTPIGINGVLLVTGGSAGTGTGLYWHVVSDGSSYGSGLNQVGNLFVNGTDHHLRVVVSGNTYSAYLDGSTSPATTLVNNTFTSGQIGLYANSHQTFDNVVLTGAVATPADIGLSNRTVKEHRQVGTVVGTLSTTEAGTGNRFAYSLVSGIGSTDNASFSIDTNGNLTTNQILDFATQSSYSIRVRTSDQNNQTYDKVFTISLLHAHSPRMLTVNTFADQHQSGHLTLREAINTANGDAPGDSIRFANGLFASGLTGTITLTQGELLITNSMTITGPGGNKLSISGNNTSGIFTVDDGNAAVIDRVTISGLTATQGNRSNGDGGAVFNREHLTLSGDTFSGNSAGGVGGAVENFGTLTSTNNSFFGNSASSGGVISNDGILTSTNDVYDRNLVIYGVGGAIINGGALATTNDMFSNDSAGGDGGSIENFGTLTSTNNTFLGNSASDGGAIYNATSGSMTGINDSLSRNFAGQNGGGIENLGSLTISNDAVSSNRATNGGGIDNAGVLISSNDMFSYNTASRGTDGSSKGGGISNVGTLTSSNDSFAHNSADYSDEGGNLNATSNGPILGGGVFNAGTMIASSDSFSNNFVANGDTGNGEGDGGAIYNTGSFVSSKTTFSTNSANPYRNGKSVSNGGAIYNNSVGTVTSVNDTFVGNRADELGGGIFSWGTVNLIGDWFLSNSARYGGGISNKGTLTSSNNLFSENMAVVGGGAVENAVNSSSGGMASTNDTFFSNFAQTSAGAIANSFGRLVTVNDTITHNSTSGDGGGIVNIGAPAYPGSWSSLNTIVAGNLNGGVASDVVVNGATINSRNTMFGDAISAGGISTGVNGNIVGVATSAIFVTDGSSNPQLTYNGGPTKTIALKAGSPAIGAGGALTSLSATITAATTTLTVNDATSIAVGDVLRIDSEIAQVTGVFGTTVNVLRGQAGTTATTHVVNTVINLAYDQRGVVRASNDLGAAVTPRQFAVMRNGIALSDNFNFGASSQWGNQQGSWTATGGVYAASVLGSTPNSHSTLPFSLADFSVDVDINSLSDGGIWLRSVEAPGTTIGIKGVLLVTGGAGGNGTGLYWHVVSDGSTYGSALNIASGLFNNGSSHHLHIVVSGNTYSAYLDGSTTPATTLTDNAFTSGRVGLYDYSRQTFDNFAVNSATLTPFGSTLDFGTTPFNTPVQKTFTITNNGIAPLIVQPVTVPAGFSIIGNFIANQSITAGQSASYTIQLNASATGTPSGVVTIGNSDSPASPFTFNVKGAVAAPLMNHAPVGTAKSVTTLKDTAETFKVSDFGFSDPNDTPTNSFLAVKITTLPPLGTLTDDGTAVEAGEHISVADIRAGKFKYTPNVSGVVKAYASFLFQVQDNGGTASGGIDTDLEPKKMTISVK